MKKYMVWQKQSWTFQPVYLPLPNNDFKASINLFHLNENQTGTNLYSTNFIVSTLVLINLSLLNRHDQVVLLTCRIWHTRVTHFYLLTGDIAPFCIAFTAYLTVIHFVFECHDLAHARDRFHRVNSLSQFYLKSWSRKLVFQELTHSLVPTQLKAT
jgi:hypothetical protein